MRQHRRRRIESNTGFTLLELLVSISILALIITISYSALRLGTRSWDASIANINQNSDTRSAIAFIKNKIEHIYPIYWRANAKRMLSFEGYVDRMRFIAPSPQGREVGEYFEYMFVINRSLTDSSLELYFEPHFPGDEGFLVDTSSEGRELLSHLSKIEFFYYGMSNISQQEEWLSEWPSDSVYYPSAIQISMKGEDEDNTQIDMIINVRSSSHQI